jgi:Flagellar hook-length control protein FliK
MNIEHLTNLVQTSVRGLSTNFLIPGRDEFTAGLKQGQVIKGEINQQLGEGRYLVNFNGTEKIIQSPVAFDKNDIIYGRVVGVGENVELQRVRSLDEQSSSPRQLEQLTQAGQNYSNNYERLIGELFARYQGELSKTNQSSLTNQVRLAENPNLMALAGLIVNKIGLQQSSSLLQSIYQVLGVRSGSLGFSPTLKEVPEATYVNTTRQQQTKDGNNPVLSELIHEFAVQLPESRFKEKNTLHTLFDVTENDENVPLDTDTQGDFDNNDEQKDSINLARWLLNTQIDGTVSHRIFTVPLNIDGQITEINIALFDQEKKYIIKDGIRYRQIVFSLESEQLGLVEVTVNVANQHLRIQVMTDDHSNTEYLAQYMTYLKNTVADADWELDEISYGTKINDTDNAVVRSVVEHYITQDSLSRLI